MPKSALDPEQWQRVEELYHATLDHRPELREDFLGKACNGDEVLRREVESLLATDGEGAIVDLPALEIAAELLEDEAPLPAGTQLGPYRIEKLLGAGGMGRVYRARDTRLNRTVAIKISKEEFSERFEREARTVAALNHPNICQLYDIGPNFLVMELVEGTRLRGPLPLAKAVEWARQILDALDAAHRKDVVHRDLKPANIMVSKKGIKLLDFGLAKQTGAVKGDATVTAGLTGAGAILGTLQYMSPEQLQGKPVDARSDLFAFGCVLYEMLTGKRAFEGENPASVIASVLEREPAPLQISPPLDRIVERCLAKDPDHRFQTAIDLKTALEWAVEQTPAVAAPARRWWTGIAAAGLVLGVAGGWSVSHFARTPAEQPVIRVPLAPPKDSHVITSAAGLSVSPDGRYFTYNAIIDGKQGIWLQPLDGSPGRFLNTEHSGATLVFWSPDSKSVGWWAGSTVWRSDLTGGAPVAVFDQSFGRGAAWTTDGRIVLGTRDGGLMIVPASGGPPAPLTSMNASLGEIDHAQPEMLPNGRFLYWAQNVQPGKSAIYAASLSNPSKRVLVMTSPVGVKVAPGGDGKTYLLIRHDPALVAQEFDVDKLQLTGEPHVLAEQLESTVGPVVSAGVSTQALLFSSGTPETRFLWRDRSGKLIAPVGPAGRYTDFTLSRDGRRIALSLLGSGSTTDLWILDLERTVLSRFTSSLGFHRYPLWSLDANTILFSNGGTFYRKGMNESGNEEVVLKFNSQVQTLCDWSRDGKLVLYNLRNEGKNDLWILPVTADGKLSEGDQPRPYLQSPFNKSAGRFSPDMKWVAYQSDETGRLEVYLASFPEPRRRVQITSGGGRVPQWGPDGRELFYVTPDYKLMSVALRTGPAGIEPLKPQELFSLATGFEAATSSWYAVAPDGKRILVNERQGSGQLELVLNWTALLKKR